MRQKICIIATVTLNNAIGHEGKLPWGNPLPAHLWRFAYMTIGKPVVMSLKTYQAMLAYSGETLFIGRHVLILSHQKTCPCHFGVQPVSSKEEALKAARHISDTLWVAGGGQVYRTFFPETTDLYLTEVDTKYPADTGLPFDRLIWELQQEFLVETEDYPKHRLCHYTRDPAFLPG